MDSVHEFHKLELNVTTGEEMETARTASPFIGFYATPKICICVSFHGIY